MTLKSMPLMKRVYIDIISFVEVLNSLEPIILL